MNLFEKIIKKLSANIAILQIVWVLRDPTIIKASSIRPFIRTLRLPRPMDPPLTTPFKCNHLGLPILPQKSLVALTKRRRTTSETHAAADTTGTREGTIVTRTEATTIEISRAVIGSW